MLRLTHIVLLSLFGLSSISAQDYIDGYVISNQGDSIFGLVREASIFKHQKKIHFVDYNGAKVVYHADRIAGYGYGRKHYESLPIPYLYTGIGSDTIGFMQRIVSGPANLYRFYTRHSVFTLQKGAAYVDFILTPEDEWFEVSPNFRWKRVAEAFEENPELVSKIEHNNFPLGQTEFVVRAFNQWYEARDEEESTLRVSRADSD
ncbi:MAG: hypothetical protein AAFQ87_14125 [Bacteroidota bacterium]